MKEVDPVDVDITGNQANSTSTGQETITANADLTLTGAGLLT